MEMQLRASPEGGGEGSGLHVLKSRKRQGDKTCFNTVYVTICYRKYLCVVSLTIAVFYLLPH